MSDYLSSVLDELVPTFADEDGDWARVVADAEAPVTTAPLWPVDTAAYPAAPRRRQGRRPTRWLGRRRLVAVAVTVLLAAFLVTPALGIADRLVSLFEGTPRPLDVQSPTWSRDGRTIVFVSWRDGNGELYAMDAGGSQPRNLTQHPAKDVRPAWSPDGRRIAFVSRRDGQSEIYLMNADGSEKRNLTRSGAEDDFPVWSHDGRRIAFLRGRLHTATVPGLGNTGPGRVLRSYSYQLYVMNADGSGLRRLTHNPIAARPFVWSPDGRTISMGSYLVNVDGSGAKRLAHIPREASGAQLIWSPDGRRIAFVVPHSPRRPGCCVWTAAEIHVMNADGSGHRILTSSPGYDSAPAWSPDGRRIAFQSNRDGNIEIYVMNADGSGQRNLTRNAARDSRPSWSPDGRRIAFVSDRDGRLEAHVMNADGSGQRNLTLQGI